MVATRIEEDQLDETFAALANGTRRAILGRLAQGPATVNELAAPFDLGLPAGTALPRAVLAQAQRVATPQAAASAPPEPDAVAQGDTVRAVIR